MKYAFFPGCVLNSTASELMMSTNKVVAALNIELVEINGWTCCGVSHTGDISPELFHTNNAQNIALAEKMGVDKILTVCNTCTLMLRKTNQKLKADEELKTQVNQNLSETGLTYQGTIEVTHLLWALIEDFGLENLKAKITNPLTGLNVANYYGCHIIMPPKIMGFDDWRNPQSMEQVMEVLGATSVEYEDRLSCCGFHAAPASEKEVLKMTGKGAQTAKESGAHVIVTPCPLCQNQLDDHQEKANESFLGDTTLMPVVHLPQLIGLALGIPPKELGLDLHTIRAIPALETFAKEAK